MIIRYCPKDYWWCVKTAITKDWKCRKCGGELEDIEKWEKDQSQPMPKTRCSKQEGRYN